MHWLSERRRMARVGVAGLAMAVAVGTSACIPPAEADPGEIVSDEFNGTLDTSRWTFVDPRGDSAVSVANGLASLSVPSGQSHNLWAGMVHAPWLRQVAPNSDFEVELKFNSTVSTGFQMQGLIVAQDDVNLVRFDTHHNGSGVRLFAADLTPTSGAAKINVAVAQTPAFIRVARAGNLWTYRYSFDGTTWLTAGSFTRSITVSGIGPFVGNEGAPAPAYTAQVDYFRNVGSAPPPPPDTTPPVISGVGVTPAQTSATVAWTTNEAATSRVDYGTTASLGSNVVNATLKTAHSLVVPDLTCGTTYHYTVTSADAAGNPASSAAATFQTTACTPGDTTPPVISGVGVTPAQTSATVAWSTDELASSRVDYGTTASLGSNLVNATLKTAHSLVVPNLTCATTYHYRITSADAAGNPASTATTTFQTTACTPPSAGIVSDEFDGSLNTDVWTFVDPVGDGSVSVGGGRVSLGVPAGVNHNLWAGDVRGPWLRQTVPNEDFEVEAKFDSVVASGYQMQGLRFGQDDANFVRVDVHYGGGAVRIYAATVAGGSAVQRFNNTLASVPAYVRVARAGNVWTIRYSFNGSSWLTAGSFSLALQVNAMGPWVGNYAPSGGAPAHTALVDYFRDVAAPPPSDTTPPVISNVSVTPGGTSAVVTWSTDELASSRVDYGTTASLGSNVVNATPKTAHSVTLSNLTCATTYHYRVTSVDGSGNSASNTTTTFQTSACAPPSAGIVSDEFDGSLNTDVWTFVDPVGDSSVSVSGGRAALSVPAGVAHDLWFNAKNAPWLRQAAPNEDFEVEVKFDSAVVSKYQIQGVVVQQDASNLVRFDTHFDGSTVRLFAATMTASSAQVRLNVPVAQTPSHLRVQRAGSVWTFRYSFDGVTWLQAGSSFSYPFVVSAIGPFVGNATPSPAYVALVDYFANVGEAPPPAEDTTPPVISNVSVSPGSAGAVVTWSTNELASSRVDYGTTAALGSNVVNATPKLAHSVALSGLACATTYHYRVTSVDPSGNSASNTTATFQTNPCGDTIDIWYGLHQHVGEAGNPQRWVNVSGNVSSDVTSLSFRLNGGASRPLTIGPDAKRLNRAGDFIVEMDFAELNVGLNEVVIAGVLSGGGTTSKTVTVQKHSPVAPSLPYTTNFGSSSNPNDSVQIVDGKWTIAGNTLRIAEMGYDRLAVLGDLSWQNYEVTMPVTVHGLSPDAYAPQHGHPVVGLALRWQGHSQFNPSSPSQPAWYWFPTGAFAWFKYQQDGDQRMELVGNDNTPTLIKPGQSLPFNVPHVFKARVETIGGGVTRYSVKWWAAGQAEPGWLLTMEDTGPATGSVGLLVHDMDASIGNVTVTPLS